MRESSFWNKLKAAGVFDYAERVENSAGVGMPDVHALVDGVEVWIELKIAGGSVRREQVIWHKRWANNGKRSLFLFYLPDTKVIQGYSGALANGLREAPRGCKPEFAVHTAGDWVAMLRGHILAFYA